MSCIAKDDLAQVPNPGIHLGSTYEHHFIYNEFSLNETKKPILRNLLPCFPWLQESSIHSRRAAVRVCNNKNYMSIFEKIHPHLWTLTAMGSRELFYHATLEFRVTKKILGLPL